MGGAPQGLERVDVAVGQLGGKGFGGGVALHGGRHLGHLELFVVEAHEGGRIADVLCGLFVLVDQDLKVAQVAADAFMVWHRQQIANLGHAQLAVTIDPAVALLEDHQRPRDVEMDQPVRLVMQVQAF